MCYAVMTILVEADIIPVMACMSTYVALIVMRLWEVEVIEVSVVYVYTECPIIACHVDGAIEVVDVQHAAVLTGAEHPTQIIVTHVEQVVVIVQCPCKAIEHIVHNVVYVVDEVVVYLIHIVVLSVA